MAQDVITRLRLESGEFNAKIKTATNELNRMTTVAEQEGVAIAAADAKNIKFFQSLGKMQTASTSTSGKIRELSASLESAMIVYNRMDAAMRKGEGGRALAASITQLQGRLKGLQTEMAAVQGKMGMMGAGGRMGIAAQFGSGLKAAASMYGPAALAIGGVTAAITGVKKVFGDMVNINMEFEQKTANLASVLGLTTDQMEGLTNQAKQLGATTRYTANEITELQTNLARLGFTQQEILNSTTAVQAFATATGADLGEAANLAGAALRGFGLNATEMERVASVMAVSTTKSALSFEKLATAVPIVAPVAKQFGFTIEDTITLLAKLSDAGMDASMAATATRNIFLKMANDSGKLSQALGRPVHSVEEFGEALKEMREKGMSLNDILSMVGVRSTAAFAVFADNADTLKDFKESITDCSDAMHDMESKQLNTLQGSVIILNSAWEGLMLTFSESNGTIRKVVDSLTALLQAYTRWRNRNQGGDAAIRTYEMAEEKVAEYGRGYIESYRSNGMSDSAIKKNAEAEKAAIEAEAEELQKLYDLWLKRKDLIASGQSGLTRGEEFAALKGYSNTMDVGDNFAKQIAQKRSGIAIQDYIISAVTPAPKTVDPDEEEKKKQKQKEQIALLKAQYEEQEKAQIAALDRMAMNEADYEAAVYKIKRETLQKIADLYQDETAEKARANAAMSQLDIQYQGIQMRLANKANKGEKDPELTALEKRNKRIQELTASIKEMNNIIATTEDANTRAWATNQLQAYNSELDKLNGKLETTSKNVAEIPTQFELMQASLDRLSTGVGAIDTLVGALDNLKGIGEDLADAFSGEMDAWDALMTVFNSGIGIMQTVIGVMEAINTLTELSTALKGANTAATQTEATTAVTAAATEAGAESTKAAANMTTAGTAAAASSAEAGEAVAGIPIVGPILAVAAIAAVLAATFAAMSKAKSAGKFATGGLIPGNSFSGDNLTANVNSGELILNRAQQGAIAGQLAGNPMDDLNLSMEVEGTKMLVLLNNVNRSLGGSRDFYTKRH